ncbi:aspartic proteinase 3 [[Candida] railenensis]|uniref:Aspartic proteinase 3 n=1 Tax=[Candida] railenensis TaxID=45579 RepID=A0A9P0QVT2_9ASCO|nr:aspartic proteinase 3 [[Candida] railenensis]
MKHILAVVILFATFYVATSNCLGTALPDGGILLDFEIQSGDTYDTLSSKNGPHLYKRDGDVKLTLRNELNMYVATLEVGSNNQKNTVEIDTFSSDLFFMAKGVKCVEDADFYYDYYDLYYEKRRRRDYISKQNNEDFAERDFVGDFSSSFDSETSVYGVETGDATDFRVETATGTSSSDTTTNTCTNYGSFETSSSSSFKRNETAPAFVIFWDDGSAHGIWGHDSIKIGSTTLDSVSFAIVDESSKFIGGLGIGLPGSENTKFLSKSENVTSYEYSNFPVLLKQQGAIKKMVYSLYLNAASASAGSVLFGAVDHAKYSGTLVTVPVLGNATYSPHGIQVMVDGISMEDGSSDISITSNKYAATLGTGFSFTYFPESLFYKILGSLEIVEYLNYDYIVNCPKSTDDFAIKFNFSGLTISVPYSNLVRGYYSNSSATTDQCYLAFGATSEDFIILGENVLSSGYFVYDLEDLTVSLAQAKYTDETDIEVISSSIPRASKASLYSSTNFETGIVESSAETIFSYATGTFTSYDLTAEAGIFEATETSSGAQTGLKTGTGSGTTSSKSSSSPTTSSTTKRSGEEKIAKYTLISNLIASAFGFLVLVAS